MKESDVGAGKRTGDRAWCGEGVPEETAVGLREAWKSEWKIVSCFLMSFVLKKRTPYTFLNKSG